MALESIVRNLRTMLWTAVCMVLLVFLIEVGISLAFIRDQKILAGMGGAMGLTVAGAIETVRRIARDLAQSNLLAVLCGELDTDALKPVIAALARKI